MSTQLPDDLFCDVPTYLSTAMIQGLGQSQLLGLLDRLPAGIFLCDDSGQVSYFNQRLEKLLGRAPKLNDPRDRFCASFEFFTRDGTRIDHEQSWMARAFREARELQEREIHVHLPDGRHRVVLAHSSPLFGTERELIGSINFLVDVTNYKRTEEANQLFASIVETSEDAIVSKSLEGRIISWNRGAEALFGYRSEEVIGCHISIIVPPERLAEEEQILARLRRGERIEHFETIRITKSGVRKHISLSISPVLDENSRVIGAAKVARDITERKQAEQNLRLLHELSLRLAATTELRSTLIEVLKTVCSIERTDLGLLSLCDPQGQQFTHTTEVGFEPAFMEAVAQIPAGQGTRWQAVREKRRVVVEDVLAQPGLWAFYPLAHSAGIRAVHNTPLLARNGTMIGVLTTFFRYPHTPTAHESRLIDLCVGQAVDFIEKSRLYEQLREADRQKDEFLATLAHELRNPLAPITNALSLLRLTSESNPDIDHLRQIMQRQVDQMTRLVEDLLEVSRITRGKIELRVEPVLLEEVVTRAVEISRPLMEAAKHQLVVDLPKEPITVHVDPVRIAQVIANLLNNAAKFTPSGGNITLTAREAQSQLVLTVRDDGVGIPPEKLDAIFEMFSQLESSASHQQGGLGVGLALAKRLIEIHHGEISARSAGAGKGSEFEIRLPYQRQPQVEAPREEADGSDLTFPSRRVLIVDDRRDGLFLLGELLRALGQEVFTADCGSAALDLASQVNPQLMISDLAMPHMDGFELAHRMRQDPRWTGLPLVALSGYGQESDRQQTQAAGFNFHLVKPVSMEALVDLLRQLPVSDASPA